MMNAVEKAPLITKFFKWKNFLKMTAFQTLVRSIPFIVLDGCALEYALFQRFEMRHFNECEPL